jgi:hypothetical protein
MLTKALLVLTSLVIALALCEAGLRFLGIEYPDFYDYDPIAGSKLRPGIKGIFSRRGAATSASILMACETESIPSTIHRIP